MGSIMNEDITMEDAAEEIERWKGILRRKTSRLAIQVASLALEKQIPMKHHHTALTRFDDDMRKSVCPDCLSVIITEKYELPKYCTLCGQAIDWR